MILDNDRFGQRERGQYDLDDDETQDPNEPDSDNDDGDELTAREFLANLSASAEATPVEIVPAPPRTDALTELLRSAGANLDLNAPTTVEVPGPLPPRSDNLIAVLKASAGSSTWDAYRKDLSYFGEWLLMRREGDIEVDRDDKITATFDASTRDVAEYVAALVTSRTRTGKRFAVSTIKRRLFAIRRAFKLVGRPNPLDDFEVSAALDGASRILGIKQRRVEAISLNQLRHLVASIPIVHPRRREWRNRRDQVLLLVGWAAALRASELVALNVDDVRFVDPTGNTDDPDDMVGGGMIIHIRRSKTDQHGAGDDIVVNYSTNAATCPVRKLFVHIQHLAPNGYGENPLFRTGRGDRLHKDMVARILKDHLAAVYGPAIDVDQYAAHSLRAGFVTEANDRRVDARTIAQTTRHQSLAMIRTYDRPDNRFDTTALAGDWW